MRQARAVREVDAQLLKHHPVFGSDDWRAAIAEARDYRPLSKEDADGLLALEDLHVRPARTLQAVFGVVCMVLGLLFLAPGLLPLTGPALYLLAAVPMLIGALLLSSASLLSTPYAMPLARRLRPLMRAEADEVVRLASASSEAYELVDRWLRDIPHLRADEYRALIPLIRLLPADGKTG